MSKLVPLLREGADEVESETQDAGVRSARQLEALLLASARGDAPPNAVARAGAIAAAKLAAHAAVGAGTAAGAGAIGWRAFVSFGSATTKGIFLAGVGIAVALGGAEAMGWPAPTHDAAPMTTTATPPASRSVDRAPPPATSSAPVVPSKPAPEGVHAPPQEVSPRADLGEATLPTHGAAIPVHAGSSAPVPPVLDGREPSPAAPPSTAVAGGSETTVSPTSLPASSSLREEGALLESARESLAASQAVRALATLDTYEAKFAGGQLAEDAAILRVQARMAAGNRAEARRLAEVFERRFPRSSYLPRVRALVEKSP